MSGALKHFFDSTFLTIGAARSVLSIVQALGWRQVDDVAEVTGDVDDRHAAAAYDLGATVAANIQEGR